MKRFTETNKWTDSWFSELSSCAKLLWLYMCDKCDCIGVYDVSKRVACFETDITGNQYDSSIKQLKSRFIEIGNGKLFLKKFIDFQYGTLNASCKPHLKYMNELKKNTLWELYTKGIDTLQEKEKEKEKETETETEEETHVDKTQSLLTQMDIEEIYQAYPKKVAKPAALKAIAKALKKASKAEIMDAIAYAKFGPWLGKSSEYIPNCATWMNQERWTDERSASTQATVNAIVAAQPSPTPTGQTRTNDHLGDDQPAELGLFDVESQEPPKPPAPYKLPPLPPIAATAAPLPPPAPKLTLAERKAAMMNDITGGNNE